MICQENKEYETLNISQNIGVAPTRAFALIVLAFFRWLHCRLLLAAFMGKRTISDHSLFELMICQFDSSVLQK